MALTKSQFITYLDCPMHLWAESNNLEEHKQRNIFLEHLSRQGYKVEDLAEKFIKEKVKKEYPLGSTVEFQYELNDGNYLSQIDILVKDRQNNTVDIYEVKSSSHIKKSHEYGVSFQDLLAQKLLPVKKTYLIHINSDYVKQGEIDLEQLFVIEDMTDIIFKHKDEVELKRAQAKDMLADSHPPLNETCSKPQTCPCPNLCHYNLPNYSIYDIPDMRKNSSQFMELMTMGIQDPIYLPSDFLLTTHQEKYLQSLKTKKPVIDKSKIRQKLDNLEFPLYFIDYETFGPAIPYFDNYSPHQNIVFQYSLHVVKDKRGKEIEHFEYLHTDQSEPSRQFIEHMLGNIGKTGSIISWYKPFENSRNKELAKLQPEYRDSLLNLNGRTFDLIEIFKKQDYVDYRFRGSSSIKNVLPVLVPTLSYKDLNIGKGDVAMLEWDNLVHKYTGNEKNKVINDLLEYCKLDTWAMVEIWRVLNNL